MAEGAPAHAGVDLTIAATGIAGPGGATPAKPVGLVHLAVATRRRPTATPARGDRAAVRLASVDAALTPALLAVGQAGRAI